MHIIWKIKRGGHKIFFEKFDDLHNFENSISFIKIDVEGNELDVLKSMKKNLENNSPIISLEFDMKDGSAKYKLGVTVELKGQEKPVCVAETLAIAYE